MMKKNFRLFAFFFLLLGRLLGQTPCVFNTDMYGPPGYSTQVLDNGAVRISSLGITDYINWGDITTSNSQSIDGEHFHIYQTNGNYPIQYIFYDINRNCTTHVDTSVLITNASNDLCNAIFTVRGTYGDEWMFTPYTVTNPFVGSQMHWDFDNGQSYDSLGRQYQNYPVEGSYNVCLTQTNSIIGCTHTYCDTVSISYHDGHSCGVYFEVVQENNFVRIKYQTEDSIPNLALTSIDYGDGIPSDGQFTHRYLSTGNYTISLLFNNSIVPWNCDTIITYSVNIDSIEGPPCDAGIYNWEYSPRGTYVFENPQTLYYGAFYQQSWNFGSGWVNGGNNAQIIWDFDSIGTYNVCNALYVPETGCADTICGNYYIAHSALGEPCSIYADYSVIYNDNTIAYIVINTQTTPAFEVPYYGTISGGSPSSIGSWCSGFSSIVEIDPTITHSVHMQFEPTYACTSSYDFVIDLTTEPMFSCDSMILGVNVIDQGNGNFEIAPILHPNLDSNYNLLQAQYNINGYRFMGSLQSAFIHLPFSGVFSGWVEFSDQFMVLPCSPPLRYYFSIDNTASPNPSICDAYFELVEDTGNIVPHTWICNNGSTGNDLSYLWDFGDGSFSDSILPYHMYSSPGFYEVVLTITDTISGCTDIYFSDARAGSELILQIIPGETMIGIENEIAPDLLIFPNPAEDRINVSINKDPFEKLTIYDITGRIVADYQHTVSLPIANLNSGIYFVSGNYMGKYYSFKFLKL